MAIFKITPTTGVITTAILDHAFDSDSSVADTLTVEQNSFLVATGAGAFGALLANTGAWTANINGTIFSDLAAGILVASGNKGASTINIGAEGSVSGNVGIFADSATNIKNLGDILSDGTAISLSAGADSVKNSGYIRGQILFGDGANKFTNSGIIENSGLIGGKDADNFVNSGDISGNVVLGDGANSFTNSNFVLGQLVGGAGADTVSNSGWIGAEVKLGDGINKMTNTGTAGEINGGDDADTVDNKGVVSSIIELKNGKNTLTHSGKVGFVTGGNDVDRVTSSGFIELDVTLKEGNDIVALSGFVGGNLSVGADDDTITISAKGDVVGNVDLGGGNNKLTNAGVIEVGFQSVFGGSGADIVTNSGTISNDTNFTTVDLGDGANKLTNSKIINGGVIFGNDADALTNSGAINGGIGLGSGNNTLTNTGIIDGLTVWFIVAGSGNDTLTNSGKIIGLNSFELGDGADFVRNTGTISVAVDLGNDNDKYEGGNFADLVRDGSGADSYKLGGGSDVYLANHSGGDLDDFVDGGAGSDTYDASLATSAVQINLDKVAHDGLVFDASLTSVANNTALGDDVAPAAKDTILNFEIARGGGGDDAIYGNALANSLYGGAGNDALLGYAGNDAIELGDGADIVVGGLGKDLLIGGSSDGLVDKFSYERVADSTVGIAGRDTIQGFEDTVDRIDLHLIDANSTVVGHDQFAFKGTDVNFTGTAGELRVIYTGLGHIIDGDVNGDGKADFAIFVEDPTHGITFTAADFILL